MQSCNNMFIVGIVGLDEAVTDQEIGDPYGGPLPLYEAARDEMVESIPSLVAHLRTLAL